MNKWFSNLSATWQNIVALGAALLAGVVIMGFAAKYHELPELVQQNSNDIETLVKDLDRVEIKQGAILEAIQFSNCMAVASAKGDPWQACESNPLGYLRDN